MKKNIKVRALRSFAGRDGDGRRHSRAAGDEFILPPGVDWIKAGLVEVVKAKKRAPKTTAKKPPENAAKMTGKNG